MKTVEIGRLGEDIAVAYLKKQKYKIVDRNIHVSHNEIDIIAKNKEYIVFVEVKTRSADRDMNSCFGTPAMAVDTQKIKRTVTAARTYISTSKYKKLQPRLDVIEIYLDKDTFDILNTNHIINAFDA